MCKFFYVCCRCVFSVKVVYILSHLSIHKWASLVIIALWITSKYRKKQALYTARPITYTNFEQLQFQTFEQYDSETGSNVIVIQEACKSTSLTSHYQQAFSCRFQPFVNIYILHLITFTVPVLFFCLCITILITLLSILIEFIDANSAAVEAHMVAPYFASVAEVLQKEGLVTKPLDILKIKPFGGFNLGQK